jgi:hypothetical protein
MSISEKRYFRRGSDGTRALDHGEIRELMLATREGSLDLRCDIRTGGSMGDLRYQISLVLVVQNIGKVPVRAPYVRVAKGGWIAAAHVEGLSVRASAEGATGIYASRDVIVHLDDEVGLAERPTGLDFRLTGQFQLRAAVSAIVDNDQWDSFRMLTFNEMPQQPAAASDRSISVSGFYGAENAILKPFSFEIGKRELLALFCRKMSLQLN